MRKKNISKLLLLGLGLSTGCALIPLLGNFELPHEKNVIQKDQNVAMFSYLDFNNPKKFEKTSKVISTKSKYSESNNTNNDFVINKENINQTFQMLQDKVNDEYLRWMKLDIEHSYMINEAKTSYEGEESKPSKAHSQVYKYSVEDLTLDKKIISTQTEDIFIEKIEYPHKYPRQIFGIVSAESNQNKTTITFTNAANLPLNFEGWILESNSIFDEKNNPSLIEQKDFSMSITSSNVGVVDGTKLNDYKMVINKKIFGSLKLTLNPFINNKNMTTTVFVSNLSQQPQKYLINSTVDSQKSPAGFGSFKMNTLVDSYSKNPNGTNLDINLVTTATNSIQNKVYDWARSNGSSFADFDIQNSITLSYPKIDPLFDYLTKQVASKAYWDTEFYYGPEAMVDKTINQLLLATKGEKEMLLKSFYKNVFEQVFNATSQSTGFKIGPKNESASELFIFRPNNWSCNVEIQDDAIYLTFSYLYFDKSPRSFRYKINSKLFLNNPSKGYTDGYNKADLKINDQISSVDVSNINNPNLKYADVFYNLYDNVEGSKKLYDSVIQYKDDKDNGQKLKLIETLFTKNQFYQSISRANGINILDKQKMIYFSTTDKNGNQYNSWSDLAKGSLKFNIEVGKLINERFWLKNYQLNKLIYTYNFYGFKTQYDIYANNGPVIRLTGFDNKSVDSVSVDWVLDNLLIYDNQSANTLDKIRISLNSSDGDNKIIGTNLLKEDFVKLVLANNKNNVEIFDRDKLNGTFKIKVKLQNIGDDPSSQKHKVLTSKNKSQYALLNNASNKELIFSIAGLQKYYDIQYNYQKEYFDAIKLGINESVETIYDAVKNDTNNVIASQLTSFEWYTKKDLNYEDKLIKTRLSKDEFFKNLVVKIECDINKGNKGINPFLGLFYGNWIFGGTQENINNALNNNITTAFPSSWEKVNKTTIPFILSNLAKNAYLEFNDAKYLTNTGYKINELAQYLPNDLNDPLKFFSKLEENKLITYGVNATDTTSNSFIFTNALSSSDLFKAIKDGQIFFSNINATNSTGTLSFDLEFKSNGGKINGQTINLKKHFEIQGLKTSPIDKENENLYTMTLANVNNILHKKYKYAYEISPDDVINGLINYGGSNVSNKDCLFTVKGISKEEFIKLINTQETGYDKKINFTPKDYTETTLIGSMIFNNIISINGISTNNVKFQITGFEGRANSNWKIKNNNVLNITQYYSSNIDISKVDEKFILNNMIKFKNNNVNKMILDNSYITLEEFKAQMNPSIKIIRNNDNSLSVKILTSQQVFPNTKTYSEKYYDSINFVLTGFKTQSRWNKLAITWTSVAIGSTFAAVSAAAGTLIYKKRNK